MRKAKLPIITPAQETGYSERHPGLCKRDSQNPRLYTWYNIACAEVQQDGILRMPAAGVHQSGEDTFMHWVGVAVVRPDQADYAELTEAIRQRCREAEPHMLMEPCGKAKGQKRSR